MSLPDSRPALGVPRFGQRGPKQIDRSQVFVAGTGVVQTLASGRTQPGGHGLVVEVIGVWTN